jgi:uncharacterized repeat protein (TIGR03803 family)
MKIRLLFCLCLFPVLAFAQTYTFSTLVNIPNVPTSALGPYSIALDPSGNIYGVSDGLEANQGTIFKVTPSGKLSVLHRFGQSADDAASPRSSLIRDAQGNWYGVTAFGGAFNQGAIFKVTPQGNETVLYSFPVEASYGSISTLARDSAGNLYGYNFLDSGSLFKLAPDGTYTVVYNFCSLSNCVDGVEPSGGPILKSDGNLYGIAQLGGTSKNCDGGCGVVFKVTPEGQETVLHSFTGGKDGSDPFAKLTQDSQGNLYGTTYLGGANNNGTVFKVTNAGKESVLYSFCLLSGCLNLGYPVGPVALDAAGNIFGVTSVGTVGVYKLTPAGEATDVYDRPVGSELGYLVAVDNAGNLYGFSMDGGPAKVGTIFKLTKKN